MHLKTQIKICGVSDRELAEDAVRSGAEYIGCVFYAESADCVTPLYARQICSDIPSHIKKVAVVKNCSDRTLRDIVFYFRPDFIQFDGDETPEFLIDIKKRFQCRVIKSIFAHSEEDFANLARYQDSVDMFLVELSEDDLDPYYPQKANASWQHFCAEKINKPCIISASALSYGLSLALRLSVAVAINFNSRLSFGAHRRSIEDLVRSYKFGHAY